MGNTLQIEINSDSPVTKEQICMMCHFSTECDGCCKICKDQCNSKQLCQINEKPEDMKERLEAWLNIIEDNPVFYERLKKYIPNINQTILIMRNENYRPATIEFDVAHDGSNVPETFGEFETAELMTKFLAENLTAINQPMTVSRHMDQKEKVEIRHEYNELLENKLPIYEKELSQANQEYSEAKRKLANATEMVNATITEAKGLAHEVKRGLVEMRLDDLFTSRVPYQGRYYFFTWIDKQLKLCAIRDIPEREKTEIWNQMAKNDEFINNNFGRGEAQLKEG